MKNSDYPSKNYTSKLLDPIGVIISLGCLIHCLLLPILIPFLPALDKFGDEHIHKTLVIALFFVAAYSLFRGYNIHKNLNVPIIGFFGLALLSLATLLPEEVSSVRLISYLSIESALTTIGGITLITAHIKNFHLCSCKNSSCSTLQTDLFRKKTSEENALQKKTYALRS